MDDSTALGALDDLARLVRRASQELDRAIAGCLGETSVGRWHVLHAVAGGAGLSMSQLADATLLNAATLTRLIDAMIADNLVHRKVDDTDRRRVLVFPTRRGVLTHRVMAEALTTGGLTGLAGNAGLSKSLTALVDRISATEPAAL
ncbi:MarR family transcriptional regulator [Nocardia sp. 2]|uniref:MarR family transcriptional regulator n=1 Tax=Nocardia acididurans TaxID=2802282 RepID=A0ABS1M7N8_9NOCA|nr:MarR family transcriptional regulator [Nocardia acididurans]MBL1076648.1 MarR family transcriptional regulator [Nocardia acididurans]